MPSKPPVAVITQDPNKMDIAEHEAKASTRTDLVLSRDKSKKLGRQKQAEVLNKSIAKSTKQADQLEAVSAEQLDKVVEKYSSSSSTFLSGVVGGAIGISAGAAVSALHVGLVLATGPIGLALGAAIGILWFRGGSLRALERVVQKINGALAPIKAEIAALKEDAPPETREHLYPTSQITPLTASPNCCLGTSQSYTQMSSRPTPNKCPPKISGHFADAHTTAKPSRWERHTLTEKMGYRKKARTIVGAP